MRLELKSLKKDTTEDNTNNDVILTKLKSYYKIRRNLLTGEIEYGEYSNPSIMDDARFNTIILDFEKAGIKISEVRLKRLIVSDYTDSYHPINDYFDKLTPLPTRSAFETLQRSVKLKDEIYRSQFKTLLWRWLLASASCALGRTQNHVCLVLVGGQGKGKTTWLNALCPPALTQYIFTGHINPDLTTGNTPHYLSGKWFVNIDDQLTQLFGKDFNALKSIITAPDVTYRIAFDKFTKKRVRIASFMASVNDTNFLSDVVNRRYLCFEVEGCNPFHSTGLIDAVWGEVKHALNNQERVYFDKTDEAEIAKMNEQFSEVTVEYEYLVKYFKPCLGNVTAEYLTSSDILSELQGRFSGYRFSPHKLNRALERAGFKRESKRLNGATPKYVWPVVRIN